MDIKKMSLPELKALAYDLMFNIDTNKQNLVIVNQQISILSQEEKKEEEKRGE